MSELYFMDTVIVLMVLIALIPIHFIVWHFRRYRKLNFENTNLQNRLKLGQEKYEKLYYVNEINKKARAKYREVLLVSLKKRKELIEEKRLLSLEVASLRALEQVLFRMTIEAQKAGDDRMLYLINVITNMLYPDDRE